MNKVLLGLNIFLVLAVGYLFYDHYQYVREDEHGKEKDDAAVRNSFKIAYFELDSLQDKYIYYKEQTDYLTKKDAQYRQELDNIRTKYQMKYKEYQEKGPSLSQSQQSDYEQQLMKLQNDYNTKEQQNNNAMQAEMAERLPGVKMKIQEFLKRYAESKGYSYVLATTKDDNFVYYKDTIRNITDSLIIGLNKEYEASKKK